MGNLTAKISGEIASFMSPSVTNIKSLKVHFSPKQLGTGDPSPENVREISGWGGVEVNGSGRNLLQNADGSLSYLYLKKGTTITISQSMDANVGYFRGYDINKTTNTPLVWINQKNNGKRRWSEYTLEDDIYYAVCFTGTGMKEAQITIDGSVDYEPYQGNNISYQWKLPDEYQEVEYIESTGTQYIELPFGFDRTDEIETRFTVLKGNVSYVSDKYIVSPSRWNDKSNRFAMGIHTTSDSGYNVYCIGFGGRSTNATFLQPMTLSDFLIHTWTYKDGVFNVGEIGLSLDVSRDSFGGTTYPLKLFYGYNSNTMGKIAYYKHKKINGDLYNLIPCYRKSDGEIGMYDIANNVFYTNQGTGTFLKGNDVDKTFYGGYVDLISGELVEDMRYKQITSDELSNAGDYIGYTSSVTALDGQSAVWIRNLFNSTARGRKSGGIKANCNAFKVLMNSTGVSSSQNRTAFAVDGESITSVADFISTVETLEQNGNGLYLAYELATPITHQLTPTQLKSFVGQNNFWSNADYVEVEYDLIETIDIQKAKQKIILNQPQLKTVSDKVVSFNTDMVAPMKNCKIYFKPIQLGSGDASVANFRDIKGWTGIDAYVNGDKISVDWTNEVGTRYNGYVDLVKGELVIDWIYFIFGRSSKVSASGITSDGLRTWMTLRITHKVPPYQATPENGDDYGLFSIGNWRKGVVTGRNRAYVNATYVYAVITNDAEDLTTAEGRAAYFDRLESSNIPIEVVYKRATPLRFQLTPQQLLTLKSTNHIWSETNGQQIDVTYWTRKNLTPTLLTNYLENQTWTDSAYISSSGKKTVNGTSASHFLTNQILLEAGTYVLSGFSYYVGSDNTNYRIHAYDSTGKWLRQITYKQIGNLSPVDISFTLDTDTYVNLSIAMDFDGVLAKIN